MKSFPGDISRSLPKAQRTDETSLWHILQDIKLRALVESLCVTKVRQGIQKENEIETRRSDIIQREIFYAYFLSSYYLYFSWFHSHFFGDRIMKEKSCTCAFMLKLNEFPFIFRNPSAENGWWDSRFSGSNRGTPSMVCNLVDRRAVLD